MIVDASPAISIPVFSSNPSFPIYSKNRSVPTLLPHSINAGLHEFITVCVNVCVPCPVVLWHLIFLSATIALPPHVKWSFNVTLPVSSAAVAVTILNIEPGSYVSLIQKFLHILFNKSIFDVPVDDISKSLFNSYGLFKSYSGSFVIARISPFSGFITIIETLFACFCSRVFCASCCAYDCILISMLV